jgi:hypothetical protein
MTAVVGIVAKIFLAGFNVSASFRLEGALKDYKLVTRPSSEKSYCNLFSIEVEPYLRIIPVNKQLPSQVLAGCDEHEARSLN